MVARAESSKIASSSEESIVSKVKIGIVGGTGYTGVELLRLLAPHANVELCCITSRTEAGRAVSDLFPNLRAQCHLHYTEPELSQLKACEIIFFATPHGVAMHQVPALLDAGVKIIDLSADFRLRDIADWESWYGQPHSCPGYLEQAVYGLPELNRTKIVGASLVAVPGCYPTAVQLGLLPLLAANVVDETSLIADAKSGVSGAGRGAAVHSLFAEAADSLKAYGVAGHRHLPEIKQGLQQVSSGRVALTFVPHLTPMIRGIHATLYARTDASVERLQAIFEEYYQSELFVDLMPPGSTPTTGSVRGSNHCRLAVHRAPQSDQVVVLSVIDNLVKGAAGQAVQCLNIMQGWDEITGLEQIALYP